MIKDKHIDIQPIERLNRIAECFRDADNISAMFLIGSQLDRPTPLSDIDLAVLGKVKFSFEQMMDLQYELSVCLGTMEVDLIDLRTSNPDFAYKALKYGKLLFVNNPELLADFSEYICNVVFDYRYHLMECISK